LSRCTITWTWNSKNKFEKLVHLVGFIIRICHDAWSPERELSSSVCRQCRGARPYDNWMSMQVARKTRRSFEAERLVTYPDRFFSTQWSDPICHSVQRIPSLSAHVNALQSDSHSSASRLPSVIRERNWRIIFLILAHPVYKMWIIHEPNKLALWNKLHLKRKKRRV